MRECAAKIISELDFGPCEPDTNKEPYLWVDLDPGDKVDWIENGIILSGTFMSRSGAYAYIVRDDDKPIAKVNLFDLKKYA